MINCARSLQSPTLSPHCDVMEESGRVGSEGKFLHVPPPGGALMITSEVDCMLVIGRLSLKTLVTRKMATKC